MTKYTAHFFRAAPEYAVRDFKADSPKKALALALKLWRRDPNALEFEPLGPSKSLDRIEISGPEEPGQQIVVWQSDDMRFRIAAAHLLGALKHTLAVLGGIKPVDS
jgi:hypothetical protein